MVAWIESKFESDAVAWFFFGATVTLCVAGIAATVFFAVAGILGGLGASIPAFVVGMVGIPVSGMIMEEKGYV